MSWLVLEVSSLDLRDFKRLDVSLMEELELPVDEVEEAELDEDD